MSEQIRPFDALCMFLGQLTNIKTELECAKPFFVSEEFTPAPTPSPTPSPFLPVASCHRLACRRKHLLSNLPSVSSGDTQVSAPLGLVPAAVSADTCRKLTQWHEEKAKFGSVSPSFLSFSFPFVV